MTVRRWVAIGVAVALSLAGGRAHGQGESVPSGPPPSTRFVVPTGPSTYVRLPEVPSTFDTMEHKIRVVTVVNGLSRPFAIAFLPDGSILVTERTGKLRVVRDGKLIPEPISGVPEVISRAYDGLMDIAVHPRFAENQFIYRTYTKVGPDGTRAITLARGRLSGQALSDVRDLFVAQKWTDAKGGNTLASRIAFGADGMLYMAIASASRDWMRAQDPGVHQGKVLRLRDDGTAPPDNPFFGRPGYKPEIYTFGHRNPLGLALHPQSGLVYLNENGPQGGDEINIIRPGRNYGWPRVSMGRDYSGDLIDHARDGMEPPLVFWSPAVGLSGMTFYTGDRFPKWKGNIFVGALAHAHLERVTFNAEGEHVGREVLLTDLKQRIRDVRQGPDGLLYLVTDASYGALLRIEPTE